MANTNFELAQLNELEYASVKEVEQQICSKLGKDVVLIAWEQK